MSETLRTSSNLGLAANYMDAVKRVCLDPASQTNMDILSALDGPMSEGFMQYPISPMDLTLGYKPVTLSDGIESVREKILNDPSYPERALPRIARAALITLGIHIPMSGAIDRQEYPYAYDLIGTTLDDISRQDHKFKSFAFKYMRKELHTEFTASRAGGNVSQLDDDTLEGNIKHAFEVIGYRHGALGRFAVYVGGSMLMPRSVNPHIKR